MIISSLRKLHPYTTCDIITFHTKGIFLIISRKTIKLYLNHYDKMNWARDRYNKPIKAIHLQKKKNKNVSKQYTHYTIQINK